MNLTEIYNRIIFNVYGDSTPPASVTTYLQGVNGLISQILRRIQREWNYSFMEHTAYPEFTYTGTPARVLSSACNLERFKEELTVEVWTERAEQIYFNLATLFSIALCSDTAGFAASDAVIVGVPSGEIETAIGTIVANTSMTFTASSLNPLLPWYPATDSTIYGFVGLATGQWYRLSKLTKTDMDTLYDPSTSNIATPEYYSIYQDRIFVSPRHDTESVLRVRYYRYLEEPTAGTWASYENDLTTKCAEAIIDLATYELALVRKDVQAIGIFRAKYDDDIKQAQLDDVKRRNANLDQMPYCDL
jgi:hypothetical protein